MTFKYRYRKQIALAIILTIIIITTGTILILNMPKEKEIVEDKKISIKKEKKKEIKKKVEEVELLSVDIKGEVLSPGLYSLKKSSRVIDVIKKAGGLTDNADTSVINLSKKITDEMVIIVYSKDQVANFKETKELEKYLQDKCQSQDENSLRNNACINDGSTSSNTSGIININTATKEELTTLNGIGEKKAEEIIKYRESNGGFKSIEDIKNIQGIGDTIFAQIKENITV